MLASSPKSHMCRGLRASAQAALDVGQAVDPSRGGVQLQPRHLYHHPAEPTYDHAAD